MAVVVSVWVGSGKGRFLDSANAPENPFQTDPRRGRRLVLARQVNDVVHEIKRDFIEREICVLDLLRENDVAVSVATRERGAVVWPDGEFPELKTLRSYALVV